MIRIFIAANVLLMVAIGTLVIHMSQEDGSFYIPMAAYTIEYERRGYVDFDLVRISLDTTNGNGRNPNHSTFVPDGDSAGATDTFTSASKAEYAPVSAEHVRSFNVSASSTDCTAGDQWSDISARSTGSMQPCFVAEVSFRFNVLLVWGEDGHRAESGSWSSCGSGCYCICAHYNTERQFCAIHAVPLESNSAYSDRYSEYCNRGNVQHISECMRGDAPTGAPDEPEAPGESADEPEAPLTILIWEVTVIIPWLSSHRWVKWPYRHLIVGLASRWGQRSSSTRPVATPEGGSGDPDPPPIPRALRRQAPRRKKRTREQNRWPG